MSIEFHCKSCNKRLRCPDSAAGTKARCPQCSEINNVPLFSDPPQAAASSQPPLNSLGSENRLTPSAAPSPPSPPTPPAYPTSTQSSPPAFFPSAPQPPPSSQPGFSPPAFTPPVAPSPMASNLGPAPPSANPFGDTTKSDQPFGAPNPYASPSTPGGMPPQPGDNSGLASSLGVVSIVIGGVSLALGFCCCPVSAFTSIVAMGLGIYGWSVAANQLKQVKFAPYLRHLEPPANTAMILCIIGTVISGLATLIYGGTFLFMIISSMFS